MNKIEFNEKEHRLRIFPSDSTNGYILVLWGVDKLTEDEIIPNRWNAIKDNNIIAAAWNCERV